jgi:hypothetical protein
LGGHSLAISFFPLVCVECVDFGTFFTKKRSQRTFCLRVLHSCFFWFVVFFRFVSTFMPHGRCKHSSRRRRHAGGDATGMPVQVAAPAQPPASNGVGPLTRNVTEWAGNAASMVQNKTAEWWQQAKQMYAAAKQRIAPSSLPPPPPQYPAQPIPVGGTRKRMKKRIQKRHATKRHRKR